MDFGQYESIYVAVSPSGEVFDVISTLVADEDAKGWGDMLAETHDPETARAFCVVALRRSAGQPDCIFGCWGGAQEDDVNIESVRAQALT